MAVSLDQLNENGAELYRVYLVCLVTEREIESIIGGFFHIVCLKGNCVSQIITNKQRAIRLKQKLGNKEPDNPDVLTQPGCNYTLYQPS